MLPFSDFTFIYFIIASIAWVSIGRILLKKYIPYKYLILVVSLSFLAFYPKPIQLILFTLYSYLIHYASVKWFKSERKLIMSLLAVLPMLMMKLDIQKEWFQLAGLSYITFRTIQTIIDTNRLEQKLSLSDFASFTLFTPTLLIGPIDRSDRFLKNIHEDFHFSQERFLSGLQFLLQGFVYKFIIAVAIHDYWLDYITNDSILGHIHMAYGYTTYLFLDFAGYSAMAVGFGKCLGIDVPINFDKPYKALNPPDFWRRWHKSLGDWLKDYFFKPIYKELSSRKLFKPLTRQNIALFLTFMLMGFWNGFQWHFIISGAVFGIYSAIHNTYVYHCKKKKRDVFFGNLPPFWVKTISLFFMINLATFAIYIFSGYLF